MNRTPILMILLSIQIAISATNCKAQDLYKMKLEAFPFGDGLVYSISPQKITKLAYLEIRLTRTPWAFDFDDFVDSLKVAYDFAAEADPRTLRHKDFRIRIVIRHKYLFFKRHVIYCDSFGYFLYKGRLFQSDNLFDHILECIPPFIDPAGRPSK
jgi:hypothetical protein